MRNYSFPFDFSYKVHFHYPLFIILPTGSFHVNWTKTSMVAPLEFYEFFTIWYYHCEKHENFSFLAPVVSTIRVLKVLDNSKKAFSRPYQLELICFWKIKFRWRWALSPIVSNVTKSGIGPYLPLWISKSGKIIKNGDFLFFYFKDHQWMLFSLLIFRTWKWRWCYVVWSVKNGNYKKMTKMTVFSQFFSVSWVWKLVWEIWKIPKVFMKCSPPILLSVV